MDAWFSIWPSYITVSHGKWVRHPKNLRPVVCSIYPSSNTGYLPVIFTVSLITLFYWSWFFIKVSCLDFKMLREGDAPIPLAACSKGYDHLHRVCTPFCTPTCLFLIWGLSSGKLRHQYSGERYKNQQALFICHFSHWRHLMHKLKWALLHLLFCNAFLSCSQIIPVALC